MELMDNLKIYTAKEIAVILKVSKTEIQNLEREGALLPIDWSTSLNKQRKRRRFIRYSHETLTKFLNGNK